MIVVGILALLFGATSATNETSHCAKVVKDLPNDKQWHKLSWSLPHGLQLTGNDQGISGHMTTRSQCSNYNSATGKFGWNYESGTTTKYCGNPPKKSNKCPYITPGNDPNCHYQFGFQGVQYGITPWGEPSSKDKLQLPVDTSTLSNLSVYADPHYTWTDTAPPSKPPFQRSRLIYDFFLTNVKVAAGRPNPASITDEIIIDLGYNKDFQFECGYYPGKSTAPLQKAYVNTSDDVFDLMDVFDQDMPSGQPGKYARMTHFRRQGGECSGKPGKADCPVNANLDLMLFINAAREYKASQRQRPAGQWLSNVELGNEIYDNIKAEVTLTEFKLSSVPLESGVMFA